MYVLTVETLQSSIVFSFSPNRIKVRAKEKHRKSLVAPCTILSASTRVVEADEVLKVSYSTILFNLFHIFFSPACWEFPKNR